MFRNLHKVGDIFLDDNRDLSPLLGKYHHITYIVSTKNPVCTPAASFSLPYPRDKKKEYPFEGQGVIPPPYNFRKRDRAAVVMIGYRAFSKRGGEYFEGSLLGGVCMHICIYVCM